MTPTEREQAAEFWARVKRNPQDRKLFSGEGGVLDRRPYAVSIEGRMTWMARAEESVDLNELEDDCASAAWSSEFRRYEERLRNAGAVDRNPREPWEAGHDARDSRAWRVRKAGGLVFMQPWQWDALIKAFDGCCAYCGVKKTLTLEHVEPVLRRGDHALWNALPACKSCNSSKNALDLDEWLSRLSPEARTEVRVRIADGYSRLAGEIGEDWLYPSTVPSASAAATDTF